MSTALLLQEFRAFAALPPASPPKPRLPRIEVDDKAVGVLEAFDRRVPGMQLYGADGDQLPKSTKVARRVLSAPLGAFWETLKMRYAEHWRAPEGHCWIAWPRTKSRCPKRCRAFCLPEL